MDLPERNYMDKKIKLAINTFVQQLVGCMLFAAGIYSFARSANFAPGGLSGLALLINYITGAPIGVLTMALNVPLILIGFRVLGKKILCKTMITMVVFSFMLDIVFPKLPSYNGDPLLSSIFSGIFVGTGCALIYISGSSTGGADFLILSTNKWFPHFSIGQITLVLDVLVVGLGGIVFGNIDAVLHGVLATFVSTFVIDKIMLGMGRGKLMLIVTQCGYVITSTIDKVTARGATLLSATGAYTKEKRDVVLCACSNNEAFKIRQAIRDADPASLIIIADSNEVFGEGFQPMEKI